MTKLSCERCQKRLSRKTARLIEGKVVCSTCMFASPLDRAKASYRPLESVDRRVGLTRTPLKDTQVTDTPGSQLDV